MLSRVSIGAIAIAALTASPVEAFDGAKYPDLSGQWRAVRPPVGGQPAFDPTKPWGRGQQAPLLPRPDRAASSPYSVVRTAYPPSLASPPRRAWKNRRRAAPIAGPRRVPVWSIR